MELYNVEIKKAARTFAILGLVFGFVLGGFSFIFSVLINLLTLSGTKILEGFAIGTGTWVLSIILGGVCGGFGGAIGTAIYNIVSKNYGGIEVEFR